MSLDYKTVKQSIGLLAEAYHIPLDLVEDTLKEALAKGYKKHVDLPSDVKIRVDFDDKNECIRMFEQKIVVPEVEDDMIEISLEDAKAKYPNILIGDYYEIEISDKDSFDNFERTDIAQVKNVLRQRTKEAQKQEVYSKYIDRVGDMVNGIVDKVEDNFVIVKLDGTEALMLRKDQIPGEYYHEGERIRVIVSNVNKDSKKGSQVLVSRSDKNLVKRLFELEVPEIYQNIVEIKALSREASERTKMAVWSNNPQVDAIGACIGPRGSRVQVIIEELRGEKIDIFEWSEDIEELLKNSLAPAEIEAVIPFPEELEEDEEKAERNKGKEKLLVVVDDKQLSIAIGSHGSNVRLAGNLVDKIIDVKSVSALEELGYDWQSVAIEQRAIAEKLKREAELEREQKMLELDRQRAQLAAKENEEKMEAEGIVIEDEYDDVDVPIIEEITVVEEAIEKEEKVIENDKEEALETKETEVKEKTKKKTRAASEYVSKYEQLAGAKTQDDNKANTKKKKRKHDDEEHKLSSKDLEEIKKKYEAQYDEANNEDLDDWFDEQEQDDYDKYDEDIDYDEYDSYYDQED